MAAEPWADLVSSRVGIVRTLRAQSRGSEEPEPPYLWTAVLSNFDFRAAPKAERWAAGKGWTEESAKAAAIGEAIERYCAHHWDPARTFVAPLERVGMPAFTPAECVLYSDAQYARADVDYPAWTRGSEITWITGSGLPDGEPVALPAGLVHLHFPTPRPQDLFTPATSNGLAAGPDIDGAVLGGLCELMERDALMIAWMNRLPAVELLLDDASAGVAARLRRHYALLGVTLRAFALPTDLPAAVILAVAFDETEGRPANVVGMGCHPDPRTALTKAAFELCQARPAEATRYREDPPEGRLTRYEDVKTLDDHSAFAAQRDRRAEFSFLWSSGETASVAELRAHGDGAAPAELVAHAGAALRDLGHPAAYVDLTTPDVEPYGYRVARVLAKGLQPIHFGHGQERLGGTRLFELPRALGLAGSVRTADDLNPCPHPMA
jgi:ribosomal protein S12 methylthiotransferase accessory factor